MKSLNIKGHEPPSAEKRPNLGVFISLLSVNVVL
jgi:hypothetical protein